MLHKTRLVWHKNLLLTPSASLPPYQISWATSHPVSSHQELYSYAIEWCLYWILLSVDLTEPLMVIVEFCAYGDLQSYLRHCRGVEDKYYQDLYKVPIEKLGSRDLLSFAIQTARGMAHLAAMKVLSSLLSVSWVNVKYLAADFCAWRSRVRHVHIHIFNLSEEGG